MYFSTSGINLIGQSTAWVRAGYVHEIVMHQGPLLVVIRSQSHLFGSTLLSGAFIKSWTCRALDLISDREISLWYI